jgi:hypothetical protein
MKITVEFESLEEFQKNMILNLPSYVEFTKDGFIINHGGQNRPEWPKAEKVEEVPAEVAGTPITPAEAAPVAIPWEKPEDAVEAKTPAVTEDFRIEVRKTLAALNKVQTGNPAKALIAEIGYKRLTDVPLELLPGLMEKAKEAMNNA